VVLDERIVVRVLAAGRGVVRLGIEAPPEVGVRRGELAAQPAGETPAAEVGSAGSGADHAG
jgi:sRNA-binding carbon storage regulator CsrA